MLSKLFSPSSIALVGASTTIGKVGYDIAENLINSGFKGKLHLVNSKKDSQYLKSTSEIGSVCDLTIFAIPASACLEEVKKLAEYKRELDDATTKFCLVISAGFSETGNPGKLLEQELIDVLQTANLRLIGPNCLGIINTGNGGFNASFATSLNNSGNVSLISHSGAIISAFISKGNAGGLGFAKIVSLGNQADLTETDFFEFLAKDAETKVIGAYLEGISRPKEFCKLIQECLKPVVILKAGQTEAGTVAMKSHSASLGGNFAVTKAYLESAGALVVTDLTEFYNTLSMLSTSEVTVAE